MTKTETSLVHESCAHENLIRAAARRLLSISVMDQAATDISTFGVPAGTVTILLTDVEGSRRTDVVEPENHVTELAAESLADPSNRRDR